MTTPTIGVRIPRELATRIDNIRHATESREAYVRRLLERVVAAEEKKKAAKR